MEKYFQFAGIEVAISVPNDKVYSGGYRLMAFQAEKVWNPHRFVFAFVDELEPPEREMPLLKKQKNWQIYGDDNMQIRYLGTENDAHMRITHCGKEHTVQLRKSVYHSKITAKTILNALSVEHLVTQCGGFVFHCSYIEHDGKAILFTAPSGTGKSTQAELWNNLRRTPIINGDRAVVRIKDRVIWACGIPFAGSSNYCENRTMPLEAIVYLAQEPETSIRKLRGYEAFSRIWEGISVNTWDKSDLERVSKTVEQIADKVPVYHLACTPDESAVIALEQELQKVRML